MWNLLDQQKYTRMLTTAMATNQEAGAINYYYVDESNSEVSVEQLKGRALVKGKGQPPVPMALTNTPPEVFNTHQMLVNTMSTFSAFSPAKAGVIPDGASGKAMGISIGQSEEYHQTFDKSFVIFNERKAECLY